MGSETISGRMAEWIAGAKFGDVPRRVLLGGIWGRVLMEIDGTARSPIGHPYCRDERVANRQRCGYPQYAGIACSVIIFSSRNYNFRGF